jgi:ketosteroid isomerase-like protein
MMRRNSAGTLQLLTCALLLAAAGEAHAQLPGGRGVDVDRQRADFLKVTLQLVRGQVGEWLAAWRGEARTPFEAHYAELATLVPLGGGPVQGREQLATFGAAAVPATSDANLTITDFDASEGIAYIFGSYTFVALRAGVPMSTGQHVTMLQRDGGRWRIRAQLYRPESGSAPWPPSEAGTGNITAGTGNITAGTGNIAAGTGNTIGGAAPPAAAAAPASRQDALTILAALSAAWAAGDDAAAAAHFTRDALLLLPDHAQAARGPDIRGTLQAAIDSFAALRTAVVDFGQAERLSWMVARYYLEPGSGPARSGHLMLVLAGPAGRRQIRSLVFTAPLQSAATVAAAAGGFDARRFDTLADSLFGRERCAATALRDGEPVLERAWGGAAPGTTMAAPALAGYIARATTLALARQGALDPDDDVRRWVPELPAYERPVLVRHLLERTSGLRDIDALLDLAGRAPASSDNAALLTLLARQQAPDASPGSERRVSRTDDALLAIIAARAAGGDYPEAAARTLLQPLGLAATAVGDDGHVRTTLADLTRLLHAVREQRAEEPDAPVWGETVAFVTRADAGLALLCAVPVPALATHAAAIVAALDGRAAPAAAAPAASPAAAPPASPATPDPTAERHDAATIAAWQGIYFSDELDAHWRLAPLDGKLVRFREGAPPQPLTRGAGDTFTFDGWTLRRVEAAAGTAELHVAGAGVRGLVMTAPLPRG